MLISVIVPVYNVENYLRKCLDSLRNQTYEAIEVIMVDDGSKDSSGIICDEYAEKYGNFYVIHKENAGLGMARNTGLEHMNGQYVTFVDSDDYLDENAIEVLFQRLTENHVDMCKAGFRRVQDDGNVLMSCCYPNEIFEGTKAKGVLLPRMIGSTPSQKDSVEMNVCGALYNTEPIKAYNIRFPSEREMISEDLVFNVDYMQHANGAYLIEDLVYNYRLNMQSLTTGYRSDRFEACRYFYLEMKKKLSELNYDQMTMYRLDRMFFIYLLMCVRQENGRRKKQTKKQNVERIKQICSDTVVQETIRNYPKLKLGVKQYLFLKLIEWKRSGMLYYLARYALK